VFDRPDFAIQYQILERLTEEIHISQHGTQFNYNNMYQTFVCTSYFGAMSTLSQLFVSTLSQLFVVPSILHLYLLAEFIMSLSMVEPAMDEDKCPENII
jgi:hypothetical protein